MSAPRVAPKNTQRSKAFAQVESRPAQYDRPENVPARDAAKLAGEAKESGAAQLKIQRTRKRIELNGVDCGGGNKEAEADEGEAEGEKAPAGSVGPASAEPPHQENKAEALATALDAMLAHVAPPAVADVIQDGRDGSRSPQGSTALSWKGVMTAKAATRLMSERKPGEPGSQSVRRSAPSRKDPRGARGVEAA